MILYPIINPIYFLQSDRRKVVDPADARLWADSKGFLFYETSALNGDGIQDMFAVSGGATHVPFGTI